MRKFFCRIFPAAIALALSARAAAAQLPDRPALPAGADPNDWGAYFDRGVQLLGTEGAAAADDYFAFAARLDPTRAEPLYARFAAFHLRDARRFGDYLRDDAHVLRQRDVLAADSLQLAALVRNPFVHRGLIAMAMQQLPGDWNDDSFTRAFLEYARGNLESAARGLELHVRRTPGDYRAREVYAMTLVHLRRFDEARAQLDSVLATLRRRDERHAVPVYESKDMLLYSMGLLYLAQNRPDQARELFAQAVLEDASQWYVHRGLALALVASGHPADAVPEYRTAVELFGDDPMLLKEYGGALSDADQADQAVKQLGRVVQLRPEWAGGWLALGNANARAGRKAAAVAAFTAYLARAPRSDAATVERIRALVEQLRT